MSAFDPVKPSWRRIFTILEPICTILELQQLLLEQLVLQEAHVFEHALAIIRTMQRMKRSRSPPLVALLPELLSAPGAPQAPRIP